MEELQRIITRRALYDLVWSRPMQHLAQQYGMSDRGLAKTCVRHLVPLPPKGHWAKIKTGSPVKRTPLPTEVDSSLQMVHIGQRIKMAPSHYVAEVLAAKLEMDREDQAREQMLDRQETPMNPVALQSPDVGIVPPSLDTFISNLQRLDEDYDGFLNVRYFRIAPTDVIRVAAFLRSLAVGLHQYGFAFAFKRARAGFAKQGSTVGFEITARRKRQSASPSRVSQRNQENWGNQATYQHVGRLRFEITRSSKHGKNHWADGGVQKIEQHLPEMIERIRVNFVIQRDIDGKQREIDARRDHLAHRRRLFENRAKREVERLDFLVRAADAIREVEEMRHILALLPRLGDIPPDYRQMLVWGENRLLELERKTTVERIQMILVEKQLYADPDELFDPEGDPPPKQNVWDD
jgi:hypothetical protein